MFPEKSQNSGGADGKDGDRAPDKTTKRRIERYGERCLAELLEVDDGGDGGGDGDGDGGDGGDDGGGDDDDGE